MAKIKILAIGSGACNSLNRIEKTNEIEFWAINTDENIFNCLNGVNKLQIGKSLTKGLGAGGDSEIGEKAVEENSNDLSSIIKDAETIITVACLGGGTGNGATPVVLNKISKETNAKNLAIVTLPFSFEGNRRMNKAQEALSKIKKSADNTIVLENDKILETLDKRITLGEAFSVADKIISDLIFEELKK